MNINLNNIKASKSRAWVVLAGVILITITIYYIIPSGWSKWLKNDVIKNNEKIDSLEILKNPLLIEIEEAEKLILKKDSIILVLSNQKQYLTESLKYYKYENYKLKSDYVNSSVNKRVELFTRLVNGKKIDSGKNNK